MIDVTPTRQDLRLYRGDSLPLPFVYEDDDTGAPIDITGRTYVLTIRRNDNDALVVAIPGVITNAAGGAFSVDITAATTEALSPSTPYKYDLRQTDGTIVTTLVRGFLYVTDDVAEVQ
jgi:hypothetical protein